MAESDHTMLEIANVNTKYRKRCKKVKTKFTCYEIREMPTTTGISLAAYRQYVSEKIREMLDKTWQKGITEKKTFSRYREFKEVRGTIEHLYDNTKGCRLLADARTGCLQTR